jgi:hypothetical protein
VTGSFEKGNELSGSVKGGELLERLSVYYLLKKESAPWSFLLSQLVC